MIRQDPDGFAELSDRKRSTVGTLDLQDGFCWRSALIDWLLEETVDLEATAEHLFFCPGAMSTSFPTRE